MSHSSRKPSKPGKKQKNQAFCPSPLVSIVLPVFNGEKYISTAIESILGQTYSSFELIVVDDASRDKTVEIVAGYQGRGVRLVRLDTNRGPARARNVGIQSAAGQWIGFIDADDSWDKERLKKLMALAVKYRNACLASDILVCLSGRNRQFIPVRSVCKTIGRTEEIFLFHSMLEFVRSGFDLKPLCPKSALDEFKIRFNEENRGSEWREFIFRLLHAGLSIVVLNQPLYKYRVTPQSLSSGYQTVKQEIMTSENLVRLPWIDKATRTIILQNREDMCKRLLSTALRERKWKVALTQAVRSPASLLYLFCRVPKYLQERYLCRFR